MVQWHLTRLAQDSEHWRQILSFLVPGEDKIIGSSLKIRHRGIPVHTYKTESGDDAKPNRIYYLHVAERTAVHYFPCVIRRSQPDEDEFRSRFGRTRDYYDSEEELAYLDAKDEL